jgi:hypothetical protein
VFPETTYETRFQMMYCGLLFINKALSMMYIHPISSSSKAMGKEWERSAILSVLFLAIANTM